MRQRLFWCSDRMEWVDHPTKTPKRHASGPQIMGDLEPYRNVIDGRVIGGRKQHRDFLRAHGCIEVGNERVQRRETPLPDPDMAIKKAFHDLGHGD